MYLLLIVLIVLAAILLSFVVLIQNSKGGGLASNFSSSNQIMGVRKTTDFLEKATWGLAGFIVVLSIITAYTIPASGTAEQSVLLKSATENAATNPLNAPAGFATPQTGDQAQGTAVPQGESAPQPQAPAAGNPAE